MFYQPAANDHGLPHDPLPAIVSPRPIGWISSISAGGQVNLAPYSFFNLLSLSPPIVGFSSRGRKHSLLNVEETGEFVCNLVVGPLLEQMNMTSAHVPREHNEMLLAGLAEAPSRLVKPPRVAASPCALECVWTQTVQLRDRAAKDAPYALVLGEVIGVHIDEAFIANGRVDVVKMQSAARCGYIDYSTVESVRELIRPK